MSGATIQRQRGTYYELTLSTPSMNFALDPRHVPGTPTYEQRYHAQAAARFRDILAPFDGPLDALLPGLAAAHPGITLLPLDDGLPRVQARAEYSLKQHRAQRLGACRCEFPLRHSPDAPPGLESPSFTFALARLPDDAVLEGFLEAVTEAVYRLGREHLVQQAARERQAQAEAQARADADAKSGDAAGAGAPGVPRLLIVAVAVLALVAGVLWIIAAR
ncbi:MAG: hypothetical protein IT370_24155 [Deltaproteobacteria bacterium]|nr:hypothetical protein [Deltaproteobacteria bacterium]